jgi:hypothetical protein
VRREMENDELIEELREISGNLASINETLLDIKVILSGLGRLISELRYR